MQARGRLNVVLFVAGVLNLAVVIECLQVHVPANYATNSIVALVEIMFLALVSFDMGVTPLVDTAIAFAVPNDGERGEIAKRVKQFGVDGEHPTLTRADWMRAIAADKTQDSYWEWVTRNELLAAKLLSLPGMHVGRDNRSSAKPAVKSRGLQLLRSTKNE